MVRKTFESWSRSARITVSLLVAAFGMTLLTSSLALIRNQDILHRVDEQSQCNTSWKKAYRDAQKPRLEAQRKRDESLLRFFRKLDRLTTSPAATTPAELKRNRLAAHMAIKAAYDDTAKQLDAQDENTYPTDECGHQNANTLAPDRPSLAPSPTKTKDPDDQSHGKTPVGSSRSGGNSGPSPHGTGGVGSGSATPGHGHTGGGGKPPVDPGSGTPLTGVLPPSAQSLICNMLPAVCGELRLP